MEVLFLLNLTKPEDFKMTTAEKMAKIINEIKKLDVNIRPIDENRIEIFDKKGQLQTADFVVYFVDGEEGAHLIVDIGVADSWLASAITFSIMNVCALNLMQPIFVNPLDKKVYLGEAARIALFELTGGAQEIMFDDVVSEFSEDGSLEDYMENAAPSEEQIGEALDNALGKKKRVKREGMH